MNIEVLMELSGIARRFQEVGKLDDADHVATIVQQFIALEKLKKEAKMETLVETRAQGQIFEFVPAGELFKVS